ncbi:hypothetical protein M0Q50_03250 [bacterium]|jgi:hypothetical protein|nr:hypothetical protein [bacterium]
MKTLEEIFVELSHIDELVIKFNFIFNPKDIYYVYNNDWLFNLQYLRNRENRFWINIDDIWMKIKKLTNKSDMDMFIELEEIVKKYFNLNNITIQKTSNGEYKRIMENKIFEDFNIDEDIFIKALHLDKLEIKFDFIRYSSHLFYYCDNVWFCDIRKDDKNFFCNFEHIIVNNTLIDFNINKFLLDFFNLDYTFSIIDGNEPKI